MAKLTIYFLESLSQNLATRVSLTADSHAISFIETLYGKKSSEALQLINAFLEYEQLETKRTLQIIEKVAQLYPDTVLQSKKYYTRLQLRTPICHSLEDTHSNIIVHTRHPVTGMDIIVNTFSQAAEIYTLLSIQRDPKAQHWLHIAQLLLA